MKRIYLLITLIALMVVTAACTSDTKVESETEKEEVKEVVEEKFDKKIELNKTLEFEQFNIEFESARAYEKGGQLLLDLKFSWRNKRLPDGSTLYVATLLEVIQNGEELEEINDSWNHEGERGLDNDVFLPNAAGGLSPVKLTYELADTENDVELIFTPTTETEEPKSITISLK